MKKKLSNGVEMPALFFGTGITYLHETGVKRIYREVKCSVKMALNKDYKSSKLNRNLPYVIEAYVKNGGTGFDTSRAYCASEFVLGNVLKKYRREDFFVVTKLCNEDQYKKDVRSALQISLQELGMDYVDCYLMHWPVEGHFIDSWKEMEKLYKAGKCKSIGVCNFNIHHLEELKKNSEIMPMINEIECHPLFTQNELRLYCNDNDIQVMAYTATGRMDERYHNTCLTEIAQKYHKSISQIILKWHQQIGNVPIVNTSSVKHIESDLNINDFMLADSEIEMITRININSRLRYDPDNCDFTKL